MTRGSPLTRHMTATQRQHWHISQQVALGHYVPSDPSLNPTGRRRTYRADRRNKRRMLRG